MVKGPPEAAKLLVAAQQTNAPVKLGESECAKGDETRRMALHSWTAAQLANRQAGSLPH